MEQQEHDFDDMRYNPLSVPKGKTMLETFPELNRYKPLIADVPKIGNDKALRYSFFIADQKSPIIDLQDEEEKRQVAAEYAGLTKADFKSPVVKEMLSSAGRPETDRMILCILNLCKPTKYQTWFAVKYQYFMINDQLFQKPNISQEQQLVQRLNATDKFIELGQRVESAEQALFSGSSDKEASDRSATETFFAEEFAETNSTE